MKVGFTREARDDLRERAEHVSTDAPRRALSFVRELHECARAIGRAPRAHAMDQRYQHLGVRRRVLGNYLILYRIVGDRVDIFRVVHGARDYVRLPE